jgi:hypothetical protein
VAACVDGARSHDLGVHEVHDPSSRSRRVKHGCFSSEPETDEESGRNPTLQADAEDAGDPLSHNGGKMPKADTG